MAAENRRNSGIAAKLTAVLLTACLAGAGYYYYTQGKQLKEIEAHIASLQSENDGLRSEISQHTETLASKEAEIETLNSAEANLTDIRAGYYETCKKLEDEILAGTNPNKIAYLTFDDGPYARTTPRYLDVLKERNVLATFFQIGRPAEELDPVYRRVCDEGHTIANHTYSHQIRNGIYRGVDYFINDVIQNREFIQEKLGYTTNILRFPGGSSTARDLKPAIVGQLKELGYGYVDWTAETGDGREVLPPPVYRDNVLNNTGGRSVLVVLMHDYSENTLIALPEIIDGLRAQGYTLLPLFYESAMIIKE
jgi:peptidoglycan/xylan/chitin deacetylase (PgdA/CDA1 family)